MRILDRYVVRQLVPVALWCLAVFLFLSCLIDLFGRLDEILRYHIPIESVAEYYQQFLPIVFVRAAPFALLLGASFVAMRQSRHQELLAMSASGTSPLRSCLPFLFVGWMAAVGIFVVNETIVPQSAATYERLKNQLFRGQRNEEIYENVALIDEENRLYHARTLDLASGEMDDFTVLEHDADNRPTSSLYASRALWTRHGWLLLHGVLYRIAPTGKLEGEPKPFVERLMTYPVDPQGFAEPQARPETMRYGQLQKLIHRLKRSGVTNLRRYRVELYSKLTLPLMALVACLIAFVGSTAPQLRGNLKGLGTSLGLGVAYYVVVAICQGFARQWPLWPAIGVWLPHMLVIWWCLKSLKARTD